MKKELKKIENRIKMLENAEYLPSTALYKIREHEYYVDEALNMELAELRLKREKLIHKIRAEKKWRE